MATQRDDTLPRHALLQTALFRAGRDIGIALVMMLLKVAGFWG